MLTALMHCINCRVNRAFVCGSESMTVRGINHAAASHCVGEGRREKENIGVRLHYSSVEERGRSPSVGGDTTTEHITSECVTNLSVHRSHKS